MPAPVLAERALRPGAQAMVGFSVALWVGFAAVERQDPRLARNASAAQPGTAPAVAPVLNEEVPTRSARSLSETPTPAPEPGLNFGWALQPTPSWPARQNFACVSTNNGANLVILGGKTPTKNDVWATQDLQAWTQVTKE